jgi:hypothetical protein
MSLSKGPHLTILTRNGMPALSPSDGGSAHAIGPKKESKVSEDDEKAWAQNVVASIIIEVKSLQAEYTSADKDRKREIRIVMKAMRARQAAALGILQRG